MEFFRFIFSGFWTWVGFMILAATIGGGIVEIVKAIRSKRTVKVYRFDNGRVSVEIVGARSEDVETALELSGVREDDGRDAS